MRKLVVAAAFAALVSPAHLHAQPAPPPELLSQPPSDAPPRPDGAKHMRKHLFISPSGQPFRGRNGFSAWFAQADADSDGAISEAEFRADAERAFKLYDTNGDGVIDGFERQAYEHELVPEITEFAFGPQGPGGGRRHGGSGAGRRRSVQDLDVEPGDARVQGAGAVGAAQFSLLNEPQPLLAADENVDGKVSHAEWTRATARRFAKLDKTHAGKLTLDTLQPPQKK